MKIRNMMLRYYTIAIAKVYYIGFICMGELYMFVIRGEIPSCLLRLTYPSGEEGNDLYFKVSIGGQTYTFTVESYLCGTDTEVYQAVKNLKVGDVIDMEGFLYWYEGVNPHITSVTAAQ